MPTAPPADARPDRLGFLKTAVAIITVILALFGLWALRHVLTPLILAVFLLLMIGGLEGVLTRRTPLPRDARLPAAIAVVVALFGLSVWLIAVNGVHIVAESSSYVARLDALIKMGSDRLGLEAAPTIDQLFRQLNPGRYIAGLARAVGDVAEKAVLVLIYLGFMLASRAGFGRKLEEMFEEGQHAEALTIMGRIQHGVEGYIWVQTVAGGLIALGSAAIMWAMGLSHVPFWSFLIFLANYIPVIGVAIGVLLPTVFGLVELDALWKPVVIFIGMELVHFVVGHVYLPRMQGKSLNIDPLVVLLSLAFWGAIFGVAGAFLSTPLTVIVMAICAEFPATRGIAILLSSDGRPFSVALGAATDADTKVAAVGSAKPP
ncbi:MAG TPA: AI-2E family transporter [Caulobacteraceae bacterium]|nr:AI-2E family transporter [Caulobacteraceae bacterium]